MTISTQLYKLRSFSNAIDDFYLFFESDICALANEPYLILVGRAGIGKSHALADLISERDSKKQTSLLLLGENFSTNEMPWTQVLRNQLRFDGNENVFLGALNAKAQSQQSRILVIIDALNEGNGRSIWPKRLKSFIRSFRKFPWLGLIVSIRDSFVNLIAPVSDIDSSIASRIYHPGFEGVEYEASNHFFRYYSILPPGTPLLHPEFQNPLFLKLFCTGLKNRGLREIPDRYHGISVVIENYLDGVEGKLGKPDALDYDVGLRLLRKVVLGILEDMVEKGNDHISYDRGEAIAHQIFSGRCGSGDKQYLKRLVSEGIVNKDLYWEEQGHYDGIRFAYQRFQDHLFVSALLEKNLDPEKPEESFKSGPLRDLLRDEGSADYNRNLVEALSVQVPECTGKELHEVAPYAANYHAIGIAFIDGLMWRRADTIGEAAKDYVNRVVLKKSTFLYRFVELSISMAIKPDFYFNADRMHSALYRQSMAERDAWWTCWLQDKYGEHSGFNPVKRLIDWAWSEVPRTEVFDESARLSGVMLSWFLTSSNRSLRDAATKALVCLFQDRIELFLKVLQQFEGVNDPYIYERLYAVAYGCALRTQDKQSIVPLCDYIYESVFATKAVYPHILLRDYARGVIEYAIHLALKPSIEVERIRPPYESEFPERLPTTEEIDAIYRPKKDAGDYGSGKWGATAILSSMTTEYGRGVSRYGDFGRYTFQRALRNWDVDYDGLSNYGVQRVFELGYDPEVFSEFDAQQGSGRVGGYGERVGKKYQWIAFYEILARVSDNCKLFDESDFSPAGRKNYAKYDGPWRPYVRDIDPTILIRKTHRENFFEDAEVLSWWSPHNYENWNEDAEEWIRRTDDIPRIKELLTVIDSSGVEWLNLSLQSDWRQPKKSIDKPWDVEGKRLWFDIGSYLVGPKGLRTMRKMSRDNNFGTNWLSGASNRYEVFSYEHYWSPASIFFQNALYYGADAAPILLEDAELGKQAATAYHTVLNFIWEEEFDFSKESPIAYHKPAPSISNGLKPSQKEGEYVNDFGEVVCFDPSVHEKGPACLLMRKDHVQKFLKERDLILVWMIQGEKQILGDGRVRQRRVDHSIGGLYSMDQKGSIKGAMQSHLSEGDEADAE